MHTINISKRLIFSLLLSIAGTTLAYNLDHGPFPANAKLKHPHLKQLPHVELSFNTEHKRDEFVFVNPDNPKMLIRAYTNGTFMATVELDGASIMPPTPFSNFDFGLAVGLNARVANLNQDGRPDFILESYSGGCGLAGGYCDTAFILSSGDTYTLTSIETLWPDKKNFIMIDNNVYFIHTEFNGIEKCNDGKEHNFWIYNLLKFEGSTLKLCNQAHPDFPKTIWYSFKPRHTETTLLTDSQKQELQKKALEAIYWKDTDIE